MKHFETRLKTILRITTQLRSLKPSEMNFNQLKKFSQYERIMYKLINNFDNGFYESK